MELALYAPGLGYYMAGARKLGRRRRFRHRAGDLAAVRPHARARSCRKRLPRPDDEILEIGAGSGALAAVAAARSSSASGACPRRYLILELSPDLRARSRDTLAARVPHLMERVAWLNGLPPAFAGVVIGNEVLDAMPVARRARERG